MWIAALILVVLGVAVGMLKAMRPAANGDDAPSLGHSCASCSAAGAGEKSCVNDCLLKHIMAEPVYFDDEELDAYRGRGSSSYTEIEAAEFAEVMHTMRQEEVKDWLRSLTSRGINLPDSLKDEAAMLAEE